MPKTAANRRQEAVALALASGATIRNASTSTKVAERTIRHWLATVPQFRSRIAELQSELFNLAVGRLADVSGLAVDTLRGLLSSNSENIRLGASRTILEHAPRLRLAAAESAFDIERARRASASAELMNLTQDELESEIAALREKIEAVEAS